MMSEVSSNLKSSMILTPIELGQNQAQKPALLLGLLLLQDGAELLWSQSMGNFYALKMLLPQLLTAYQKPEEAGPTPALDKGWGLDVLMCKGKSKQVPMASPNARAGSRFSSLLTPIDPLIKSLKASN